MKILTQGNKEIMTLLSLNGAKPGPYKVSNFVIKHETKDGTLLGNTLTGEIVLLSEKEKEFIDSLPQSINPLFFDYIHHGYVLPIDCNEAKRLEQIRYIYTKRRMSNGIITHYNILPTTSCNARCFYCYQSDIKHITMTEAIVKKVIDYIVKHHGNRKIHLEWFGGEPTLCSAQIDFICKALSENNIDFESSMVSNGFLFSPELVCRAKQVWFLKTIQITLDGTEKIYNETKAYVNVKENAYKKVINNISFLLKEKINVNIRLNMDEHNEDDLENLIDDLSNKFRGNPYLAIYVRQIREDVGFLPVKHSSEEKTQLYQKYLSIQKKLEQLGWAQIWRFTFPSFKPFSCMADDPYSVQITPSGILSKCEDRIFDHTVGSLDEGVSITGEMDWWRSRIMHEDCLKCVLLPSCTHLLEHCPVRADECILEEKQKRIALCHMSIEKIYDNWKNNGMFENEDGNKVSVSAEV